MEISDLPFLDNTPKNKWAWALDIFLVNKNSVKKVRW